MPRLVSWQHIKFKSPRMKRQNISIAHMKLWYRGLPCAIMGHPIAHSNTDSSEWVTDTHIPSLSTRFLYVSYSSSTLPVETAPAPLVSSIHFALFHHRAQTVSQSQKHELFFFRFPPTAGAGTWMACHTLYAEEQATQGRWLTYHVCWMNFKC